MPHTTTVVVTRVVLGPGSKRGETVQPIYLGRIALSAAEVVAMSVIGLSSSKAVKDMWERLLQQLRKE